MAAVTIDTGPVSATDRAANVPRAKWWKLIDERRNFCRLRLPSDCRELLRFVDEAVKLRMWEHEQLRCDDLDSFIRRYLDLDPEMVGWAVAGLKALKPGEPVPYEAAVEVGKLRAVPGRPTDEERNACDYKHYPRRFGDANHTLARLRRDDPEMAERVERGELTANAAAVKKGWRQKRTPYQDLCAAWRRASAEQRNAFEDYIAAYHRKEAA